MIIPVHADIKTIRRVRFTVEIPMPYYGRTHDGDSFIRITPIYWEYQPDKIHYYVGVLIKRKAHGGFQRPQIKQEVYFPDQDNGDEFMNVLDDHRVQISKPQFEEELNFVKDQLEI